MLRAPDCEPFSRCTGSALTRCRLGRAKDEARAIVLALFPDWSPRTQARYWIAFCRLRQLGAMQGRGDELLQQVLKACARRNGSLSVSKFERISTSLAAQFIDAISAASE